jgi:hypothetical protein
MHQFQTSHLNNTIDLILSEAWDFKNPEDAIKSRLVIRTVNRSPQV